MKNEFYHAFTIGFNWYMLVGVVMLLGAIIIGSKRPKNCGGRIKLQFGKAYLTTYAAVCAMLWGVLFVVESHRGVLQFFDNTAAPNDHPLYAMLLAGCAYVLVPTMFGFILYVTECIAHWAALGKISEEILTIKKHNKKRKAAYETYVKETEKARRKVVA